MFSDDFLFTTAFIELSQQSAKARLEVIPVISVGPAGLSDDATVCNRMGTTMSDLESYLTSKLNSQYGRRYQQLLDELRAIQKIREVPESRPELIPSARSTLSIE
jgi:hypothetical protein